MVSGFDSNGDIEGDCRILVVDDGSTMCSGMIETLSAVGSVVTVRAEGDPHGIAESIRQVRPDMVILPLLENGVVPLIRQVRMASDDSGDRVHLSVRELDVVRKAAGGLTNCSIARQLSLSEATVKTYWRRIFKKLDVHDRTTAVATAISLGLLHLNPPAGAAQKSPAPH